jgi:hypothetical protein
MNKKIYTFFVKIAKKLLSFDEILQEKQSLEKKVKLMEDDYNWGYPKGHYYSPVHKKEDLIDYDSVTQRYKKDFMKNIPGFSEEKMIKNYNLIKKYFKDFNFPQNENKGFRFFIHNSYYPITDALVLFGMLRHTKPKKIIEIGSGFSSSLMMDTNQYFLDNKINITFIEPYPDILISRMKRGDNEKYKIISKKVQSVPLKIFTKLNSGDILFIDSTHVSKFNSDVNYELFDILPILKKGVIIHFHDIFYGFEYPLSWLEMGRAWNENYLLRAFLTNNEEYEILLMNNYLTKKHKTLLINSFNETNTNGGSLWIKKV